MPVTVTVTLPVVVKMQDSVELPDPPVMLVGDKVQAELLLVKPTVPVKPFRGEIVIDEVPAEPTTTLTVVGLAAMVKSGAGVILKVTVAKCDSDPEVPVTVTVNEPVADPVQERVDVPDAPRIILVEDRVQVRPVVGKIVSARPTVPVKPFKGARVIVEVPAMPTIADTDVGLAAIVKSGAGVTVNATVAV